MGFFKTKRDIDALFNDYNTPDNLPIPLGADFGSGSYTDVNGNYVSYNVQNSASFLQVKSFGGTIVDGDYYKAEIINQWAGLTTTCQVRLISTAENIEEGYTTQGLLVGATTSFPLYQEVGTGQSGFPYILVGSSIGGGRYTGTIANPTDPVSLTNQTCTIYSPNGQSLTSGKYYYGKNLGGVVYGTDFTGSGGSLSVATKQTDSSSTSLIGGSTSSLVAANQTGVFFANDPVNNWTTINIAEGSATQAGAITTNTQTFLQNKFFMGINDYVLFANTNSISSNRPTTLAGNWNVIDKSWLIHPNLGSIVWTNGAKSFYISCDLGTNYFSMIYGDRTTTGQIVPGVSPSVGFDCREISGTACLNADCFSATGLQGFTGSGAFTNFTIVGGIITSAS